MRLDVEFDFAAAHRLPRYDGLCFRMHGHNYKLRVGVEGTLEAHSGMILDFVEIQRIVQKTVLDRCDHQTLNDFIENPTAEVVISWIWRELKPHLSGLVELRLHETPTYSVTYRGS